MYFPYEQILEGDLDLVVRSALPVASLAPMVRRTLGDLDPRLSATDVRVLDTLVDLAISPRRFLVTLLGGFSMLALALACLGIYSTVAYGVGERVQEFGVRMALGASSGDIRTSVIRQTLTLAALGVTIGAIASFALARLMASLLYDTSTTDAVTFGLTALLLSVVAVVAGYVPAARASRVSPMAALRSE
jgi:ABC-type antimicrobial peptide transport system permease subunit